MPHRLCQSVTPCIVINAQMFCFIFYFLFGNLLFLKQLSHMCLPVQFQGRCIYALYNVPRIRHTTSSSRFVHSSLSTRSGEDIYLILVRICRQFYAGASGFFHCWCCTISSYFLGPLIHSVFDLLSQFCHDHERDEWVYDVGQEDVARVWVTPLHDYLIW
jgi:hypothetical protein